MGTHKKMQSLSRQGSLYNLTLDEIQTQLVAGVAIENGSAPAKWQGSLMLARDMSNKTVDELWKDIQQGKSDNNENRGAQERQTTLGEMTLEDFLLKAGVVHESTAPGQKNAGPVLDVNSIAAAQKNVSQHSQGMQYQLPSVQPQPEHQQNLMCMPRHTIQHSIHVTANPVLDAQYPENQLTMSPSSLIGTLSDTQTPERKRVAPGDVAEKTVVSRQKRMIKNRESAARSRARKQAYTQELENQVSLLEQENERHRRQRAMEISPCAPPLESKYQLRRTGSASF